MGVEANPLIECLGRRNPMTLRHLKVSWLWARGHVSQGEIPRLHSILVGIPPTRLCPPYTAGGLGDVVASGAWRPQSVIV